MSTIDTGESDVTHTLKKEHEVFTNNSVDTSLATSKNLFSQLENYDHHVLKGKAANHSMNKNKIDLK